MTARSNGNHTAAAMIMGKTWLMTVNPASIKATPAIDAPNRLRRKVRAMMYMVVPARNMCSAANQP